MLVCEQIITNRVDKMVNASADGKGMQIANVCELVRTNQP